MSWVLGNFLIPMGCIPYETPSGGDCCSFFNTLFLFYILFFAASWPGICREFVRGGREAR